MDDRMNILMVDDQPGKLLSYEAMLGELGENLIKASSGQEALEFLLKSEVAVVLMDVCMPELDGFQLAQMIREHPRFRKVAMIFISAVHLAEIDHPCGLAPHERVDVSRCGEADVSQRYRDDEAQRLQQLLAEVVVESRRHTDERAQLAGDRVADARVVVPEHDRAVRAHQVDVLVAVDVPDPGPPAAAHELRVLRRQRPRVLVPVHAARDDGLRPGAQFLVRGAGPLRLLTVPGAASCSVKWLVMATVWLACFEGSATGAAAQLPSNVGVGLTGAGEGRGKTLFASKLHACRGG